jgi:hypothetical protein
LDVQRLALVPTFVAQIVPHAPQLAVVVNRVSQPLVPNVSQSAWSLSQVNTHLAAGQVEPVALVLTHAITFPHVVPQVVGDLKSVSQPVASMMSQLPYPGLHVTTSQSSVDALQVVALVCCRTAGQA